MSFKQKATQRARDLVDRGLDRHIRLAVTGLSGAGKTALLTGLLEQLLYVNDGAQLPYWQVARRGGVIGSRLVPSSHWSVSRFDYEGAVKALTDEQSRWPESTRDVSEIRLELKVKPQRGLAGKLTDQRRITLDLIDYPGEWLLDLPMLAQSYDQWSQQQAQLNNQPQRQPLFAEWQQQVVDAVADASSQSNVDTDHVLRQLAASYRQALQAAKQQHGLYFLQPGRHLLAGDLADAPALDFFPWPEGVEPPREWLKVLEDKFRYYQNDVIKPFYQNYFQGFNRQIILVDVLTALATGEAALSELQLAINELMKSFDYGRNDIVRRLFSPQIDKVALVASKADHVAPGDHVTLQGLLNQLLGQSRRQLDFERIDYQSFSAAGIAVSRPGQLADGTQVLDGIDADGKRVRVGAPVLTDRWPSAEQWQQGFAFPKLYPNFNSSASPLPHIRLDKLLEFLLGDKLQ